MTGAGASICACAYTRVHSCAHTCAFMCMYDAAGLGRRGGGLLDSAQDHFSIAGDSMAGRGGCCHATGHSWWLLAAGCCWLPARVFDHTLAACLLMSHVRERFRRICVFPMAVRYLAADRLQLACLMPDL
jgi:hypothetical protein